MNEMHKIIIKRICLIISIIFLIVIAILLVNYNNTVKDGLDVPVNINPTVKKEAPKIFKPEPKEEPQKPFTRDENNMPKSDINVPEIG